MSYAVGVDVPISQMPVGMAFDGSGGGGGNDLLGSIGSGLLKGLTNGIGDIFGDSGSEESGRYGSPRGSYVDDTKRMMQTLLLRSMENFDPSRIRSTVGTV